MKLSQIFNKRIVKKISFFFLLILLSWIAFESTNIACAEYPVQDRFFRGPLVCSCGDGTYGCAFSCRTDGDDCYAYSYCFCPCY